MKITIESKTLLNLLNRAKSVTSDRPSVAALSCVALTAKAGELSVFATNMDLQIESSAPCTVEEEGDCAVSARILAEAVSGLGSGAITIACDNKHHVSLSQGRWLVKLKGLPVSEMIPPLNTASANGNVSLTQKALGSALRSVIPCASTDPTRHTICGVGFVVKDCKLAFVCTDGRRMRGAWTEQPFATPVTLPTASALLLASLCGDSEAPVELSISDQALSAASGEWRLASKLIEGNYPSWQNVVPTKSGKMQSIIFPKEAMLAALRAIGATVVCNGIPQVTMTQKDRLLHISSNTPDVGESTAEVSGGTATVSAPVKYNSKFVRDMIDSFEGPEIEIQMADNFSPCVIEDATGFGVMIPFRIV